MVPTPMQIANLAKQKSQLKKLEERKVDALEQIAKELHSIAKRVGKPNRLN